MLNHKDLMIGNYVFRKSIKIDEYITEERSVVIIDSIYNDALSPDNFLINGYPLSFFEPVPITERWLSEFNFYHVREYDEWVENMDGSGLILSRCYESGDSNNWCVDNIKIRYIHELQNLFRIKRGISLFI